VKNLTLNRSWFITNSLREDEFDYVLSELGIPEDKWEAIDEITINGISESDVEVM